MRTDRLSFEDRPMFERVVTGLVGIGAVMGVIAIACEALRPIGTIATLAVLIAAALLGASSLRGSDDTFTLGWRVFGVFGAAMIGFSFDSLTAMVVSMGAMTGLAMAGTLARPSRQAVGIAAGIGGTLWAIWAIPALSRMAPGLPLPMRCVAAGLLSGIFVGAGLLPLHLRVHVDALSARLQRVGGETGMRLGRIWDRCHASLRSAPVSARRELLAMLEVNAREAERLAALLVNIDARLVTAGRKDAESQMEALKNDVAQSTDATARARLSSAVASLSDSLEALDAMERKRERLGADLKLKVANLERAALAIESAQGEPAELRSLMLRLSQPAATA